MSKLKVVLLLCAWLTVGCGDGSEEGPPDAAPEVAIPPLDPALQARVDADIASIQSDPCLMQRNAPQCQWADYEIGAAQFNMARSSGEAILIIDGFTSFMPELLRHRNRIAGYYQLTGHGIEPEVVTVRLPKRLGDVLVSFAGPEFIPTSALAGVGLAAWPAYGGFDLPGSFEHGVTVVSHLIDLVPEQPLVLVDDGPLHSIPPEICEHGLNSETLAEATAVKAALAASLKRVMIEHNVRFINASFGATTATLAATWEDTCAAAVPGVEQLRELLHIYDPIYAVLFNSEGVLTAHASAALGDPADFPFDQVNEQYPNQVRAGFITSLSSGLDEVGRGTVRKGKQFPGDGAADVYLNWGCEEIEMTLRCADRHHELVAAYGLKIGTFPLPSTSFISPLALARLINLRYGNHAGEPMSNALIQSLKRELTPPLCGPDGAQPCVYQDPIVHRQLEVYRLQYLPTSETSVTPVDIFAGYHDHGPGRRIE